MNSKIYISGGITGIAEFEQIFQEAEDQLVSAGYEVVNPVKVLPSWGYCDCPKGEHSWLCYMRYDIVAMMNHCDKIALIEGFEYSRGSRVELQLALGLGFKYGTVEQWIERAGE